MSLLDYGDTKITQHALKASEFQKKKKKKYYHYSLSPDTASMIVAMTAAPMTKKSNL